jgi:hypothetical protein
MDSPFFSDQTANYPRGRAVAFTPSVPFEQFAELKQIIQARNRWLCFKSELSYFDTLGKPKKSDSRCRFLFIRQLSKKQSQDPVQLDLFIPHEHGYELRVIVSNKQTPMKRVPYFHNGGRSQEITLGELKSQCNLDYVAVRQVHGSR